MIDFPAAPVAGQIFFASNGAVYQYNSTYTSWIQIASSVLQDGTFQANASGAQWAPTATGGWETANPTVVLGNIGGWYNAATGVYTPPAGRYYIWATLSFNSSTSNMLGQLRIRKNGVVQNFSSDMNTAGTNLFAAVHVFAIVDANGTDTFEVQVQCNVLMSNALGQMGAFPLSQAASIPGGGSSWRQVARTVVGVATPTIDFQNIPSDINDISLRFDITPATNAVDAILRWYDAGGVLLSAGYSSQLDAAANTQALGSASAVFNSTSAGGITTGVILNYGAATARVGNVTGIRGQCEFNNIRDAARAKGGSFSADWVDDAVVAYRSSKGAMIRSAVGGLTGLQLSFSSGNIAVGSTATLWGSP